MARAIAYGKPLPWSARQIVARTGTSHRTVRAIIARGLINPDIITAADALAVQCVGAADQATLLTPDSPTLKITRDEDIVRLARETWTTNADQNTTLLITTDTARLLTTDAQVIEFAFRGKTEPVLFLPVGQWAANLRTSPVPSPSPVVLLPPETLTTTAIGA